MSGFEEVVPGLLRWSAPHPEWRPGAAAGSPDDWDEVVGSVLFETDGAVALIDPLIPREDRGAFLTELDRRVDGRPVSVLTTIRWHRRDRDELAARYAANRERAWNAVPRGVEPKPLPGAGETMYWLPGPATLVPGDRLLGDRVRGLRVCPESWLSRARTDRAGVARMIGALLELPVERVLVSHGDPVLRDGRAALARAVSDAGG